MSWTKRITTRELLRNFKSLKDHLLTGTIHYLVIDVGRDKQLELTVRKSTNTGTNFAKCTRGLRKPIAVKNVHIFDKLLP